MILLLTEPSEVGPFQIDDDIALGGPSDHTDYMHAESTTDLVPYLAVRLKDILRGQILDHMGQILFMRAHCALHKGIQRPRRQLVRNSDTIGAASRRIRAGAHG